MNELEPAFPQSNFSAYETGPGMTLRDYFAAQALIGILGSRNGFLVDCGTQNAATYAYQIADHMLAERGQGLIRDLATALNNFTNRYVNLINSGDCGNWDPEKEPEVIAARAALAKAGVCQ